MSQSHFGEQLLAYLDGELSPDAAKRVEIHLAQCPQCTAELAELRALGQGLDQTLAAVLSPVKLSREADDRIRSVLQQRLERRDRAGWFWRAWGQRMRVAQAALAMMLLVFSFGTFRVLNLPAPAAAQEVLVFGESRLAPGGQGALRVIVRTAAPGSALPGSAESAAAALGSAVSPVAGVRVIISLLTESGVLAPLYEGETDPLGTVNAAFTVPEVPEGKAELLIETRSAVGEERLQRTVEISRAHKIYIMTDKPAYRPGQTVQMRALVLDAATLLPVSGESLQWQVAGLSGKTLCRDSAFLSDYGVSTWECALPSAADEASYVLSATLGDTTTERDVRVDDYDPPAFKVSMTMDRPYYAPGDTLTVTVDASHFFGIPVVGGGVVLSAFEQSTDGRLVYESRGNTNPQGRAELKLVLPLDLEDGPLVLEAQVVDLAGQVAGIRQIMPVNRMPLVVRAMPESGGLKLGVENDVYVMVTTPDGRPVAADLIVQVDGEAYRLSTDAFGLAVLPLIPSGDTELAIEARDTEGNQVKTTLVLRADTATQNLLLHTEKAIYEVGETLHVTVLVSNDGADPVYLDVVQDGRMVVTLSAPVRDGVATFALDLGPDFAGALELRANTVPVSGAPLQDTRVVVVDPPQALDVEISADRDRYVPGGVAHLDIETARVGAETGPVPAALGISVVDGSVLALDSLPAGFARAYVLANEEILARRDRVAGLELPSLLNGMDGLQAAQDLAAQAAWAGAPVADASLQAQSVFTPVDAASLARQRLADGLHWVLAVLPVVVIVTVVLYLRRGGLLSATLKRVAIALGVGVLLAPVLFVGLVVGWLLPVLGAAVFSGALVVALVLLGILFAYGWRRKRAHVQLFAALLLAYMVLAGLALGLASSGVEPGGGVLILLVAAFLLLILAVLFEGQSLVLERVPGIGWSTTVLALVLAILAVAAPAVPALRSELTLAVGNPALYAGPLGWLSGCAGAMPEAVVTAEPEAAEEPMEAEVTVEAAPTAMPMPTATVPVVPVLPVEPYPLRQIFPETLYWDPDAETDARGRLALNLSLADSLTTWQVTVLASTLDGAIGAASVPLVVSQDLVLDVDGLDEVTVGDVVTLTLSVYNTSDTAESVVWQLPDADGFDTLEAPEPLTIPAKWGAGTTWVIRPERVGSLSLEIGAIGERSGDRVLVELEVVR